MESFQILIVLVLMVYFKKSQEDLFLYFIVASSLVIYVYAVISLNRRNGEEFYKNAYYMYVTSSLDGLSGLLNRRSWYEKAQKIYALNIKVSIYYKCDIQDCHLVILDKLTTLAKGRKQQMYNNFP